MKTINMCKESKINGKNFKFWKDKYCFKKKMSPRIGQTYVQ